MSSVSLINGVNGQLTDWSQVNWKQARKVVRNLRQRIFRARKLGQFKQLRRLQKLLIKSHANLLLSVRQITQINDGKRTAGVDKEVINTPSQRVKLVNEWKMPLAKPTRRVYIPKANGKKRPLGIPIMYDRALQALVKLALEPEWEARFEPNSYGFRPGRSCHDAIEAIFNAIRQKAKFVLDADIAKCFDRINHKALLEKLNTFPTIRRQIRAWLKAGVMDGGQMFPTSEGTPQGGVISPLLANIALHGMETRITQAFPKRNAPILIRYADDFVIVHEDITVVQRCQQIIAEWLKGMGLELKPSKTRITHTLHKYEAQQPGFDFLGFTIRQFKAGKYQSGKNSKGKSLGFKTIIKPSKKKLKEHAETLRSIIRTHKSASQWKLINRLNPVIRGWGNYYSTVVSKEIFSGMDKLTYQQLRAWANHRHPNKDKHWTVNRYWLVDQEGGWVFANRKGVKEEHMRLRKHSETRIVRHIKVQGERSPYDGDTIYWSTRMGRHPEVSKRVATLLKKQKGKCTHCELTFKHGDLIEVDHKIPRSQGGKDTYNNLQLLHRHCHDKKTALDAVGNERALALVDAA